MWRRFTPVLLMWISLLALTGVLGLAGHAWDLSSPWVDVAATVVGAGVVLACTRRDWPVLAPLLGRLRMDARGWWVTLLALFALPAFVEAWMWLLERLGATTGSYLDDYRTHDWPLWTAFLMVSICPAVIEEFAFRGFIQQRLSGLMGPREVIAVQGAMFSVLHMSPLVFPSHFVCGVVLGTVRRVSGSLYPGMVIHALWNAWVLVQELS